MTHHRGLGVEVPNTNNRALFNAPLRDSVGSNNFNPLYHLRCLPRGPLALGSPKAHLILILLLRCVFVPFVNYRKSGLVPVLICALCTWKSHQMDDP